MVAMLTRLNSRMLPPIQRTRLAALNPSAAWASGLPAGEAGGRRGSGRVASAATMKVRPSRRRAVGAEPSTIRPAPIAGPSTTEACCDRPSSELAADSCSRRTTSGT